MKAKQTKSAELVALGELKGLIEARFGELVEMIEDSAAMVARNMASKEDLAELRQEVKDEFGVVRSEMATKEDLLEVQSYLGNKIDANSAEIRSYINKTDSRIATLEVEAGKVKEFVGYAH